MILIVISLFFLIMDLINSKQSFLKLNKEIIVPYNLTYDFVYFDDIINNSNYIIIDVREPEEYKAYHINNSINLRHGDILRNNSTLNELIKISKDKIIALYCYSNVFTIDGDGRSGNVASFLKDKNISVKVISGGIKNMPEKNIISGDSSLFLFENVPINNFDSDCIVQFTYLKTALLKNQNEILSYKYPASYLTTFEWDKIMDKVNTKKCVALCIDRGTCFYARLFGMKLIKQGGEFEGFILK